MKIGGEHLQSIWFEARNSRVYIIDQTRLPRHFEIIGLGNLEEVARAISQMQVRGAPLIGVTAAYGLFLAMCEDPRSLDTAITRLQATRPTAVNLRWALARCEQELSPLAPGKRRDRALELAQIMEKEDIATCEAIGEHGSALLQKLWEQKGQPGERLNILTHCNAGALATVDWGTALGCVYKAAEADVPVHVWVDETRPRNQGAALTCWELGQQDIPHTLIVDNAGGHLMQRGRVDVCVVGSDRTTLNGDVCNKIGTYLKALAARDNDIPFYAALPVSSIDFELESGRDIPIEERAPEEVTEMPARDQDGQVRPLRLAPEGVAVSNPGFDVTPAALVSGLITEHGVVSANRQALLALKDRL